MGWCRCLQSSPQALALEWSQPFSFRLQKTCHMLCFWYSQEAMCKSELQDQKCKLLWLLPFNLFLPPFLKQRLGEGESTTIAKSRPRVWLGTGQWSIQQSCKLSSLFWSVPRRETWELYVSHLESHNGKRQDRNKINSIPWHSVSQPQNHTKVLLRTSIWQWCC